MDINPIVLILIILTIYWFFFDTYETFMFSQPVATSECNKGHGCPCGQNCYRDFNTWTGNKGVAFCRY